MTRLLLFVATSEFAEIEDTAPGIVAAASDLLLEILVASTQPPSDLARADHSGQWRDTRDSFLVAASKDRAITKKSKKSNQRCSTSTSTCTLCHLCAYRDLLAHQYDNRARCFMERRACRKQKRSSQLHDEEAELAAERRLESMEEKLAASLRNGSGGQGSARPWTPWDNVSEDSGFGSGSAAKASRHVQRGRGAGGRSSGESSQSRREDAAEDVWGSGASTPGRRETGHAGRTARTTRGPTGPADQQQRQKRGSDSRKDFMSLVGDGAVDGAGSKSQPQRCLLYTSPSPRD